MSCPSCCSWLSRLSWRGPPPPPPPPPGPCLYLVSPQLCNPNNPSSGTSVGSGSVIQQSVVGRNCIIGDNCTISNSYIWGDCVIGDGKIPL
jgi:hypothetical protein